MFLDADAIGISSRNGQWQPTRGYVSTFGVDTVGKPGRMGDRLQDAYQFHVGDVDGKLVLQVGG